MAYPRELARVDGPLPQERVARCLAGLGKEGPAASALVERGLAPPELPTGFTLALLSGQPKSAASAAKGGPVAVAGGVWVREQFTIHRPVPLATPLQISGTALRRFVRKGRSYATTHSQTRDAADRLVASNLTTGLERYRADPDRADSAEGVAEAELPLIAPDTEAAVANPCGEALRGARAGDVLIGEPVHMSLARLQARDGPKPSNPIHSDPEEARRAGLDAPIAGGAHVLAFAQELVLKAWGIEALYHGAHVDVRFTAPVRAGAHLLPRVEVTAVEPDLLTLAFELRSDDVRAAAGQIAIPLVRYQGPVSFAR